MITLINLWGPFSIQSYGTMIVLGIITTLFFIKRDKQLAALIPFNRLLDLVTFIIIAAIIGGRALFILETDEDIKFLQALSIWRGGFSVLGSIITTLIVTPLYLYIKKISIIPLLDRIAIYAPLLLSISRLGCFLAGCCYGKPSNVSWTITYTNSDSLAPLHQALHPTQLYSTLALFCIFILFYIIRNNKHPKGYFLGNFLFFIGLERYLVDFLRGDSLPTSTSYSQTQLVAVCLMAIGLLIKTFAINKEKK